jgi:hypothetical protein
MNSDFKFREHVTNGDPCWCQPTTEAVEGRTGNYQSEPDWTLYVWAMQKVEARRALIADVDLPAEYAKAAASVSAELILDLAYAQADARHHLQRYESAEDELTTMRRMWADTECDRAEAVRLRTAQREPVIELCSLALFHAQHEGVSPEDRKRILDLVVRISEAINR